MMIQKLNQGLRDMLELDKEAIMYDSCYWPEVNKTVGVVSKVRPASAVPSLTCFDRFHRS